jgi:hypothetical protein
VILGRVDGVDAHDVGVQLFQQGNIALTAGGIGQRVGIGRITAGVDGGGYMMSVVGMNNLYTVHVTCVDGEATYLDKRLL